MFTDKTKSSIYEVLLPFRNPIFLSTDVWWTTRFIVEETGTEPIDSLHLLYWPHVKQTLGIREWLVNTLTLLGTSVSSNSYVLHAHLLHERRGKWHISVCIVVLSQGLALTWEYAAHCSKFLIQVSVPTLMLTSALFYNSVPIGIGSSVKTNGNSQPWY